jgi:hypothetical protein
VAHAGRAIENGKDRRRLVEVDPHRRILHRRKHIPARIDDVDVLRRRAKLHVRQPAQQLQRGRKDAGSTPSAGVDTESVERQSAVRSQPHQAAVLELNLRLTVLSSGKAHPRQQRQIELGRLRARLVAGINRDGAC